MTGGRVVVLGPTGRNFAAGMSGGIAYVLDPDGTSRALQHGAGRARDASSAEDFEEVRALVEEHAQRTESTVADGRARPTGTSSSGTWVKVMPMDYKRALREASAGERPASRGSASAATATARPVGRQPRRTRGDGTGGRNGEAGQHEDAAWPPSGAARVAQARSRPRTGRRGGAAEQWVSSAAS